VSEGPPVKVLYIAGSGRSGSTILDRILGQLNGFFSVGELCNLWDRGLLAHRRCGCGVPVDQCPTWTAILAGGFGRLPDEAEATRVLKLRAAFVRVRHIPRVLATRWLGRSGADDELLGVLARLYRAVQQQTGCRVLVDSSKAPLYAELLARIPSIDLYVVHLVRDPRATAYSWLRRKELPDFGDVRQMQRLRPLRASGLWTLWQTMSELLMGRRSGRYLRLRYEDFVAEPQGSVRRIAALVGEEPAALPFVSPAAARLGVTHSVSGNPNRFETGAVQLRPDTEWVDRLARSHRALVTAVTWPLLLRYRYPLRPGSAQRVSS
jgi:sulfotransferase family protein